MPGLKQGPRVVREPAKRVHRWSADMVSMLKVLWSDGKGDLEIATALNQAFTLNLTRNAIQGKINSLKLPGKKGRVRGSKKAEHSESKAKKSKTKSSDAKVGEPRGEVRAQEVEKQSADAGTPPAPASVVGAVSGAPEEKTDNILASQLVRYRELLDKTHAGGPYLVTDLQDNESNLQALYRAFPIHARPEGGFPKLCRWPVGSDGSALLVCGKCVVVVKDAPKRLTPRCILHQDHGVRGGTKEAEEPARTRRVVRKPSGLRSKN